MTRLCPVDGAPLAQTTTSLFGPSVVVDTCPRCAGFFLDKDELLHLTGNAALNARLASPVPNAEASLRACPACGRRMELEDAHGVELEACGGCGGLWLDGGELGRLTLGAAPETP